jgi:hypothetical protein
MFSVEVVEVEAHQAHWQHQEREAEGKVRGPELVVLELPILVAVAVVDIT